MDRRIELLYQYRTSVRWYAIKSILNNRFATLFTYLQPFNETSVFSGQSCCGIFTDILFKRLTLR